MSDEDVAEVIRLAKMELDCPLPGPFHMWPWHKRLSAVVLKLAERIEARDYQLQLAAAPGSGEVAAKIPSYHCSGQHHGDGHQFCPRELHHHHDETCIAGYREEILKLRIEIDRLRAGSGEGRELREALMRWVNEECRNPRGSNWCQSLRYNPKAWGDMCRPCHARAALRQGDAEGRK